MLRPNYTPEGFRELAENALLELVDNSDALEIHDVRTWGKRFARALERSARNTDGGAVPGASEDE
jgi:hypothetical protein